MSGSRAPTVRAVGVAAAFVRPARSRIGYARRQASSGSRKSTGGQARPQRSVSSVLPLLSLSSSSIRTALLSLATPGQAMRHHTSHQYLNRHATTSPDGRPARAQQKPTKANKSQQKPTKSPHPRIVDEGWCLLVVPPQFAPPTGRGAGALVLARRIVSQASARYRARPAANYCDARSKWRAARRLARVAARGHVEGPAATLSAGCVALCHAGTCHHVWPRHRVRVRLIEAVYHICFASSPPYTRCT